MDPRVNPRIKSGDAGDGGGWTSTEYCVMALVVDLRA
jgi:hypothetical protein